MYYTKWFINYMQRVLVSHNTTIVFLFLSISILFGGYMYFVENMPLVKVVFFIITTATTVGYGREMPETDLGMILCSIYMILSIGTLSVIIASIIEKIVHLIARRKRGFSKMRKAPSLVIIGYPNEEKVRDIISEMRVESQERIVVITNQLEEAPEWFTDYKIKFIKGHISKRDTLTRGNISSAEIILLMSETNEDISDDSILASALLISSIKTPESRVIIEFNTIVPFYKKSLEHCVLTTLTSAHVLAQEILDEGAIAYNNACFQNTTDGTQYNFEYIGKDISWLDLSYKLSKIRLVGEAYKENGKFEFLPDPDFILKSGTVVKYRGKTRLKLEDLA